jgi:hypothetical protein
MSEKRRMFEATGNKFHLNYESWVNTELDRLGGNIENEEFKMNFRLLWQDLSLGAIDIESFEAAAEHRLETGEVRQFRRQVAGLDLGRVHDSTVLTIMEVGDPVNYNVSSIMRDAPAPTYLEKTIVSWFETGGLWREQLKDLVNYLAMYAVDTLCVDATGVGDPIAEELALLLPTISVIPVKFSVVTKDHMYKAYLQEISAGRLFYAAGEETRKTGCYQRFVIEHRNLEKEWTGAYLSCHAPEGEHDDYCDSGALACYATTLDADTQAVVECSKNNIYTGGRDDRYSRADSRSDRYR